MTYYTMVVMYSWLAFRLGESQAAICNNDNIICGTGAPAINSV